MSSSAVSFPLLVLVCSFVVGQQPYSTKLETELRDYLFADYDPLQRPSQTVRAQVTLNLQTVNSLDIKEQQLSVSGYFYMVSILICHRAENNIEKVSTYLAIILCLSALTIILTIVVIDLYFNIEGDDVPAWLNRFTHHVMVKFSCWKGTTCCSGKNRVTPTDEDKGLSSSRMILKLTVSDSAKLRDKEAANEDLEKESKLSLDTTFSDESTITEYSWKEIALIMDKCFLYIFMILVFLTTTITFIILGVNY
ncbi:hypothetical protein CHS0354_001691 [Potamilus streckersoni]|uniref:Neurotransmitter-gated ion-channel transmembrane domain-containing protein n=1 Tax=Potamilus streckersoni TaxID=2493646 RepID=A0AAE0VMZ5_9BIVA|nr:hypothetical protein CHS0354_001691 [Potamilus streckersoni]